MSILCSNFSKMFTKIRRFLSNKNKFSIKLVILLIISISLLYLSHFKLKPKSVQVQVEQVHIERVEINSDRPETIALKLKYQYEERQKLVFKLLRTNLAKLNPENLPKKPKTIYLRHKNSNKETCGFKNGFGNCIFLRNIDGEIDPTKQTEESPDFSWKLRNDYGVIGQQRFFDMDYNYGENYSFKWMPQDMMNIFLTLEAPMNCQVRLDRPNDLLINYWRGSDIWWPYFVWKYTNPKIRRVKQFKNYALGKKKMAAIFMSQCYPNNNRIGYVQELQKYMDVDFYGKCGNLTCPKGQSSCDAKIKDYYFYLAFENSNCRDYITEKFVRGLAYNAIPVALGAHPDDYRDLAPEGSYILVENFSSPQKLAQFLINLSNDHERYNSYFEWKGTGYFNGIRECYICNLCNYLHYSDMYHVPKRNFSFVFSPNEFCLPRNQWYWTK